MDRTIYRCFLDVVARDPNARAIRCGGRDCTYGELDRRAQSIAASLALPSDATRPVVVLAGTNPIAEIAAIVGVIAAGAAVLPIDAREPAQHLRRIIDLSRPSAVLASRALLPLAAEVAAGVAVREIADDASMSFAAVDVSPDAPAYICYTSGSTGEPKGIAATHGKTVTHARASAEALAHGPGDRHTLLHSLAAGAARATIWRALLSGGSLLPRRIDVEGVAGLRDWLDAEGATALFCSPTLYRTFVASLGPTDQLRTVRVLRLVGERVLPEDFASFKRHFARGARFVNAYSLTETGNVALSVLTHDSIVPGDVLPVGYPRAGRRVRIVDERGETVPAGVVGEIVAEEFRTGDLGRMDPDGLLFHLGRRDFQVKVRGFRVEIEGVEATLVRAPGVTQSAVLVRNNSQGDPMLVAYAAGDRRVVDEEGLRAFAVSHLPEGSVPSRFVLLDALPLTASGKVDRRALGDLEDATLTQPAAPVSWSDRSVVERSIAGIWRELLGHDRFAADEGFLAAGGDSLLAMRVLTLVRQQLGVDVALNDFLRAPTVVALARVVERRHADELRASDAELERLLDEIERGQ
ncbi:MAG TPA: non-ribosomal peptide synthetase [Vicinamibacterales bacterium]|nr:non-ribosomal peptide synthetase [Vicinamibacterales bacterium]